VRPWIAETAGGCICDKFIAMISYTQIYICLCILQMDKGKEQERTSSTGDWLCCIGKPVDRKVKLPLFCV